MVIRVVDKRWCGRYVGFLMTIVVDLERQQSHGELASMLRLLYYTMYVCFHHC